MDVQDVLLRFGELTLKGRNRAWFEDQAVREVKRAIAAFPNAVVEKDYGRLYVRLNGEPYEGVREALGTVFGLVSFSPVIRVPLELDAILDAVLSAIDAKRPEPRTFKISVRRANKRFPYTTRELNPMLGSRVLERRPHLKVDLHRPDIEVSVEIRDTEAFVYSDTIPGLGGFPVGTNGKAVLLLSGGIDSPVAGWLAMRRGLAIEAVHFHSMPYTSDRARQKVIDLAAVLARYCGQMTLHLVSFTDIQLRLKSACPEHLLITMMRRSMFRIAQTIAGLRGARGIVTGESLGQVASQTLASLHVIGKVADLPVIRPLIATDKTDIVRLAEKIGTYSISIRPYEDCCTLFVPKSPSTNPNLRVVERFEHYWDWLSSLEREAAERVETLEVTPQGPLRDREAIESLF
ncbi:MAG: tRNA 4-thiouridine(8) synthase ThiI [Candidatus Reconcilbacillus cellulovorans]|uniref:Probable tRNA sulfurtransferase n=1 Tax=Candidatus Reconcilbacillus cellulovorans TaxID=1906605 RepID=A0A2A6DYX3_9BACL|nr:MAG: tRNA 4-thiouridine(8) synthase ThiI [Candidatus Reconcilbacillus cellulovorans]